MKKIRKFFTFAFVCVMALNAAYSQENTTVKQESTYSKIEKPLIKLALKPGLKYSLADDDFQGGRAFDLKFAAISLEGKLDKGFDYYVKVNMAAEPNLSDAYIRYTHSDQLKFSKKVGAQLNFDARIPEECKTKSGASLTLKVKF